jgi:hypothetical protein
LRAITSLTNQTWANCSISACGQEPVTCVVAVMASWHACGHTNLGHGSSRIVSGEVVVECVDGQVGGFGGNVCVCVWVWGKGVSVCVCVCVYGHTNLSHGSSHIVVSGVVVECMGAQVGGFGRSVCMCVGGWVWAGGWVWVKGVSVCAVSW